MRNSENIGSAPMFSREKFCSRPYWRRRAICQASGAMSCGACRRDRRGSWLATFFLAGRGGFFMCVYDGKFDQRIAWYMPKQDEPQSLVMGRLVPLWSQVRPAAASLATTGTDRGAI